MQNSNFQRFCLQKMKVDTILKFNFTVLSSLTFHKTIAKTFFE